MLRKLAAQLVEQGVHANCTVNSLMANEEKLKRTPQR